MSNLNHEREIGEHHLGRWYFSGEGSQVPVESLNNEGPSLCYMGRRTLTLTRLGGPEMCQLENNRWPFIAWVDGLVKTSGRHIWDLYKNQGRSLLALWWLLYTVLSVVGDCNYCTISTMDSDYIYPIKRLYYYIYYIILLNSIYACI